MPQSIPAVDPRLAWPGAVSLEPGDGWVLPWRLPHEKHELFHELLCDKASTPAGVRIRFRSDTQHLAGRVIPDDLPGKLDLVVDDAVQQSINMPADGVFRFEPLPSGEKTIELWLPQLYHFRLIDLSIGDQATLHRCDDHRPRWVTYGSSITHCRTAASPTQTWPAIVARRLGLNLTCLGFGGNCHLEPMVARVIRELPADAISLCAGINILSKSSLSARTFRSSLIGFVQIIREKHPRTPLMICSPIHAPRHEQQPNAVGLTLADLRDEVFEAVASLRKHGDNHLRFIDGLEVFGPELADHLPDRLHPDAEGYRRLAANLLTLLETLDLPLPTGHTSQTD